MKRDSDIHVKLPTELKKDAKIYAVIDNRTLSGFVVEAVKQRIEKMKKEQSKAI
jgi:hypothetical protein